MSTTLVHVHVNPESCAAFIAASQINRAASVQEDGNLRFDFLQSASDPNYFILYEAYATPEAAAAHKQTAHYIQWRDAVAPMMAKPRTGEPFIALAI